MDYYKHLGEQLQRIRLQKRMTRRCLSELSGVHETYLFAMERGNDWPPWATYELVCNALGVSTSEIFEGLRWTYAENNDGMRAAM
ncbi:helix-turn-helix domain-containing protein [Ruminococcaceae bacterium OttesenSCG-928-L11]|nr:helix-turn-helix domain-containing protein [Ruminococcaceae bacterium OttesenSCG-928-L11]